MKKQNFRILLAAMLSLVMVASLTACGGGGNTSQTPAADPAGEPADETPAETPSEAPAASEPADTGDKQVITLYRGNDNNGAVEAVIEGFEAAHSEYTIKWVEASNDTETVRNQLNTAFAAGSSEYDIISIDTVWAGDMAGAGYLEALDSYIMDTGRTLSDYNPGSLQAGTYKAKTYALPLYPDFGSLFIRKDIVAEDEVEKLVSGDYTFDYLLDLAEKYAGEEGTTYGMNFQANQYEGLVCNLNEWTANYTDIRGGLEAMKRAVDSDTITPGNILVYQESETATSFTNGEVVFSRNWPYQWGLLAEDSVVTQDQVEIAPMPLGNCIGGWLVAMNANSADKEAAWLFLDYMTSMDGQKAFCSAGGYVPGYNAAAQDADVLAANELLSKPGFLNALNDTIARPSSDAYAELSNNIQISAHKYLSGTQDLDATVEELETLLAA